MTEAEHQAHRDAIAKLAVEARKTAMRELEQKGELTPRAYVYGLDGKTDLLLLPFGNMQEKYQQRDNLRVHAKARRALAVIFVSDSWVSIYTDAPTDPEKLRAWRIAAPLPEHDPKRRECLYVALCIPGRSGGSQIAYRREGKRIVWEECLNFENADCEWNPWESGTAGEADGGAWQSC